MSIVPLVGHEPQRERFRRAYAKGKLASTFLFVGLPGIGKRQFANWFAQALLCADYRQTQGELNPALEPCGECRSCKMFGAGSHPDFHVIVRPKDKSEIPVELFIGDREHRMREGLLADLAIKPGVGRRKIAIIDDADTLNEAGANCLLKTLEEPPLGAILILVGGSEQRQLPTIRSRCQIMRFQPLSVDELMQVANLQSLEASPDDLRQAAEHANGSLQQMLDWLDPQLHEFRDQLRQHLQTTELAADDFPKTLLQFIEAAGTETRVRRRRLERVIDLTIDHYRSWMRGEVEAPPQVPMSRAADAIEICLAAQSAINSNANLSTLIDGWLIELGQVLRGETQLQDSFANS